jgi:hypothetical protein
VVNEDLIWVVQNELPLKLGFFPCDIFLLVVPSVPLWDWFFG